MTGPGALPGVAMDEATNGGPFARAGSPLFFGRVGVGSSKVRFWYFVACRLQNTKIRSECSL